VRWGRSWAVRGARQLHRRLSINFLVGIVIGGIASISGAFYGALFIQFIPNLRRPDLEGCALGDLRNILLVFVYLMPTGVAGFVRMIGGRLVAAGTNRPATNGGHGHERFARMALWLVAAALGVAGPAVEEEIRHGLPTARSRSGRPCVQRSRVRLRHLAALRSPIFR